MLAALNLGLDFNVSLYWQSKSHEIIEVKTLETHTFDVTDDYIKMLLASTPVKDHLKKHPKDYLYLVSGLKLVFTLFYAFSLISILEKVAKGAKQNVDKNACAGADMSAGDAANNIANIKALKLAWKRSKRREFKTATDFVMAVRLRRIKLDDKGELADHYLSLKKTTMEDGTPVVKEYDQGPLLVYAGLDDDLSPEKKIFMKDLYEVGGKPKEEREVQNIQNFDEADDYVFLPDLSDEEDE
ncbi:hypothetical protein UCRPA7_8841 [Phaeoacremonium minimum UCRPA7]|uniref:Uncharacterized protein n=1 Tax=Phaeoacremonium minimum (strain UCR-PA7) TaxID=1286976 RepID=R8B8Z2_PHAM7|nr:hypothetical protein UCRPA7_8841 [Phaeoacremonium minimum UCRPA7]EON95753.1 hypothetical protein UCRPA7_8841 [Phaeoacremonium minimum UCRPA7]